MVSTDVAEITISQKPRTASEVGLFCGFGAYLWWGFLPLYLKLVAHVAPLEVLGHRIVWSLLFVILLTAARQSWPELWSALRHRNTLMILFAGTILLTINWYVYIYAITNNRVIEGSLGYFINPLVNVLLGMIFFRERLRAGQAVGLVLAAAGVSYLTWSVGALPWIAITLALTFGFYGLCRKVAAVSSISGLTIETAILLLPALVAIVYQRSEASVPHSTGTWLLLALSGIATAVPLLLFSAAARRLRMMTLGFLQYLAPTCQFLLAVIIFNEPFTRSHAISFGLIWAALAVYSWDSYRAYRRPIPINP